MLTDRIIQSLLDNDFYNFTMGQLIWQHFATVDVSYRFINRTRGGADLATLVDPHEFDSQVQAVRKLRFGNQELAYLRTLGIFDEGYLAYLRNLELPVVTLNVRDGELGIDYHGPWAAAILWETPLLAIVNELAARTLGSGREAQIEAEARRRFEAKLVTLKASPDVKFVEFGTRRRASFAHQRWVLQRLAAEVPAQLLGTSNVELARQTGLTPMGTMAHQLFMVTTALEAAAGSDHPIATSQAKVLDLFEAEYGGVRGGKLLTFLPDTFGTETSLALLEPSRAARWAGFRQDSGDPFEVGERLITYWEQGGIDPQAQSLMFSDGLDLDLMKRLAARFGNRTNVAFGWGTNLTNDTPVPPLSIVIKPVAANGYAVAKLSDNLAKATGEAATIASLKQEAGYHVTFRMATVY